MAKLTDISELDEIPADDDLLHVVDVSDTTETAQGTSFKVKRSNVVGDRVKGVSESVDGEIVLFDSTTGKLIKRATGSGVVKATSGVYSTGDVNLTSEVTDRLPFANLATGTARSVVGRAGSGNGDVGNISAGNDTILSRSGSGNVAFNNASTTKTILALVKGDVGLGNVDNTSDATKNSATATLTNKTVDDGKLISAINAQTGTSYTLVLADASKVVTATNASPITVTIPPNSSVAFPIGTKVFISQGGAGSVTIAQGSGVTINAPTSAPLEIDEENGSRIAVKTATNTWLLV